MQVTDLIAAPYAPPTLRKGDRTFCLYRDRDVIVTTWTDARISWPRCRAIGSGAGSGLLITDELARAIKTESAIALRHWFGVGERAVWNWRKAFGIEQRGTEGSRRLYRASVERVKAATTGVPRDLTSEERQRRSQLIRKITRLRESRRQQQALHAT